MPVITQTLIHGVGLIEELYVRIAANLAPLFELLIYSIVFSYRKLGSVMVTTDQECYVCANTSGGQGRY